MRCWDAPNRSGTGAGYQRDGGILLELPTRAGRLLCPLGCLLSISISKLWGKRTGSLHTHQRLPQHPWVSPSPLTFSVFTDSVSLVGMLAVGRRKGLRQCAVWHDVPRGWAWCRFSGTRKEGKEAHQEHKAEQPGLSIAFASCRCRESQ